MSKLPVLLDISKKKVVVVGGGDTAYLRVQMLLPYVEGLTVIASELTEELAALEDAGAICWQHTAYRRELILDADMVIACTEDALLDKDIYVACKCLGITVYCDSDERRCDFFFA